MISVAVSLEQHSAARGTLSYFPYPPIILLTLKRIVSVVYLLHPCDIVTELLVKICDMNVSCLFDISFEKIENVALHPSKFPFAPLLWKESLVDLTKSAFRNQLLQIYPGIRALYKNHKFDFAQSAFSHSVSDLIKLVQHPISEVREGVLVGCLDAFTELTELDVSGADDVPTKNTLVSSFLGTAGEADGDSFLTMLFRRILAESEPPVLQLTLQLILR